jgi:hypothetical protein
METVGIEPTPASVQAKRPATGIPGRCERVESNHHSTRPLLYRQLSSPVLSVRMEGRPAGIEPALRASQARMLAVTSRPPRGGNDRTRTGASRSTAERSRPLSYIPVA